VRMGWYKEVQVKSLAAHERMALLGVRRRLVDMRVEIDGQIRGRLAWWWGVVTKMRSPGAPGCLLRITPCCQPSSTN
jgi:hypothetical protein